MSQPIFDTDSEVDEEVENKKLDELFGSTKKKEKGLRSRDKTKWDKGWGKARKHYATTETDMAAGEGLMNEDIPDNQMVPIVDDGKIEYDYSSEDQKNSKRAKAVRYKGKLSRSDWKHEVKELDQLRKDSGLAEDGARLTRGTKKMLTQGNSRSSASAAPEQQQPAGAMSSAWTGDQAPVMYSMDGEDNDLFVRQDSSPLPLPRIKSESPGPGIGSMVQVAPMGAFSPPPPPAKKPHKHSRPPKPAGTPGTPTPKKTSSGHRERAKSRTDTTGSSAPATSANSSRNNTQDNTQAAAPAKKKEKRRPSSSEVAPAKKKPSLFLPGKKR